MNIVKSESGRSMVEMLGVLAIIGVLSVTGVAGYQRAMTKHKANEILNEASKRAIVISTQLQAGKSASLAEFTNNEISGATFSTSVNLEGTDKFKISFEQNKNPTLEICNQMKNISGTSGTIKAYGENCSYLVYNNDLTTEQRPSDFNGDPDNCPGKYCSGSELCLETGSTCACSGTAPTCKSECDTNTGSWKSNGETYDSTSNTDGDEGKPCMTDDNKDGVCNSGRCEADLCADKTCPDCQKCQVGECVPDLDKNGLSISTNLNRVICYKGETCYCLDSSAGLNFLLNKATENCVEATTQYSYCIARYCSFSEYNGETDCCESGYWSGIYNRVTAVCCGADGNNGIVVDGECIL